MTRRLLTTEHPPGPGWAARDPRDPNGPAPRGLAWIRVHAERIAKMSKKAIETGDSGDQLRAIAESARLAQEIKDQARQSFTETSGGIASLAK